MHYTLGIKHRFLPIWKKYKIIAHWFEGSAPDGNGGVVQFPMRICLKDPANGVLVLPRIAERVWRLYPDYSEFTRQVEEMRRAVAAERARLAEEE